MLVYQRVYVYNGLQWGEIPLPCLITRAYERKHTKTSQETGGFSQHPEYPGA